MQSNPLAEYMNMCARLPVSVFCAHFTSFDIHNDQHLRERVLLKSAFTIYIFTKQNKNGENNLPILNA